MKMIDSNSFKSYIILHNNYFLYDHQNCLAKGDKGILQNLFSICSSLNILK